MRQNIQSYSRLEDLQGSIKISFEQSQNSILSKHLLVDDIIEMHNIETNEFFRW